MRFFKNGCNGEGGHGKCLLEIRGEARNEGVGFIMVGDGKFFKSI